LKGQVADPKIVSLTIVYSLSQALGISPLEIYQMPASLVKDLLLVHAEAEKLKAEEMDKATKSSMNNLR